MNAGNRGTIRSFAKRECALWHSGCNKGGAVRKECRLPCDYFEKALLPIAEDDVKAAYASLKGKEGV